MLVVIGCPFSITTRRVDRIFTLIHHEPDNSHCQCGCALKRIGEDVSEKLDYTPGVFTVERHIRGKWVCDQCETLIQAPVPAHVIDKGIPPAGLLAHVMVAKFADHLPLYRQEEIFGRAGLAIARSTLAQWVGQTGVQLQPLVDALREAVLAQGVIHADETPVQMLTPGAKKTHRAYVWAYATSQFADVKAVVYDFSPSRAGEHARNFLQDWKGKLVCDDFAGYKFSFELGVLEIGCLAHARRKFFELHATNKSQLAEQALRYIQLLYEIECEVRELEADLRRRIRQEKAVPVMDTLHAWMIAQRQLVHDGSAISKALDYSLKRWTVLSRYLDDGALPIDNNHAEQQIRPWALGRKNWLFAGSLRSGKRAAALMSLIQSAKLNGHDPYEYLKDDLALRPFSIRDHAQLERWAENIQSSGYMARFKPDTAALVWNVIVCKGQDVGSVWLERTEQPDEARLGILLGEPALLGRGIGRKAILLTIEAVTRVHPLRLITLNVRESNERGISVMNTAAFMSPPCRCEERWDRPITSSP